MRVTNVLTTLLSFYLLPGISFGQSNGHDRGEVKMKLDSSMITSEGKARKNEIRFRASSSLDHRVKSSPNIVQGERYQDRRSFLSHRRDSLEHLVEVTGGKRRRRIESRASHYHQLSEREGARIKENIPDSSDLSFLSAKQKLAQQVEVHQPDSMLVSKAVEQTEAHFSQRVSEQVSLPASESSIVNHAGAEQLNGYQGRTAGNLQSKDMLHHQVGKRIAALGPGYEDKIIENMSEGQKLMTRSKKKYKDLTSISAEKGAARLQDRSLRKRVRLGGNLGFLPGDDLRVNLSPRASFQIFQSWVVGLGISYELGLYSNDQVKIESSGSGVSTHAFSQYEIFRGFSMHAEYVWPPNGMAKEGNPKQMDERVLLGINKKFSISRRVNGNVQVLYNLLYDPMVPGSQRWEYRLGFQLNPKRQKEKDN